MGQGPLSTSLPDVLFTTLTPLIAQSQVPASSMIASVIEYVYVQASNSSEALTIEEECFEVLNKVVDAVNRGGSFDVDKVNFIIEACPTHIPTLSHPYCVTLFDLSILL